MEKNRIEMSQRERDVLKVMSLVLKGQRTQKEASRLLGRSERQVRRIQRKLEARGDGAVVHRLRGRPSNRRLDPKLKQRALASYRAQYAGLGPTHASEKLAEGKKRILVAVRTLREWLVEAGLWVRHRRRDRHRSRRMRRECFGEMVQADASEHDWLEGRGPRLELVGMIDDATSRIMARFYPAETTEAYMDLLGRWLRKHGRPVSWYCDRHGIFRAESKLLGEDQPVSVPTQFSRALEELDIELILANSPQAKGRIERLWGTAQDRLVSELRIARAKTIEQANRVLKKKFIPWFSRHCTKPPASGNDAHRPLGPGHNLSAILSHQEKRTVGNDYTIRLENQVYQLLPPAWPGERGGEVVVEKRADGSMHIRFKGRYLPFEAAGAASRWAQSKGPALVAPPLSLSDKRIPAAGAQSKGRAVGTTRPAAVHSTDGPSGRTPALPYHPAGKSCGSGKKPWRPAPDHPWRRGSRKRTGHSYRPELPDISIGA